MPKKRTIAQQAGDARRSLKRKGTKSLTDNYGRQVPVDYIPALDLLKHFKCLELMEEAEELKMKLREFKAKCQETGDQMYEQLMEENEIRENSVGGFTLSTFDKDARVIYKMDTIKEKNPEHVILAGEYWNKFMQDEYPDIDPKEHFLHSVVNELVFNTKDEIDTGLINLMNRYSQRIANKFFKKFLQHLNLAYDTRHTKRYEVFEKKDNQNSYKSVILSYSKVSPKKTEK